MQPKSQVASMGSVYEPPADPKRIHEYGGAARREQAVSRWLIGRRGRPNTRPVCNESRSPMANRC
jgi:hypothetical protein